MQGAYLFEDLSQRTSTRKTVFVLFDRSFEEKIADYISCAKRSDCFVVMDEHNGFERETLFSQVRNVCLDDCLVSEEELADLHLPSGGLSLVLIAPKSISDVQRYTYLKPDFLGGLFNAQKCDTFMVWEQCRTLCEEMLLIALSRDDDEETLWWKKQDDSDIELSVVFPVYNVAEYIATCIETVTAWKAPYIEYLFVDDGSPDNSKEIIEKYQADDARIKIISKENGGCASARQVGLEQARGRYISFIDPDDYVDVTIFEKLLSRALKGSYDFAFSGYAEHYQDTGTTKPLDEPIAPLYRRGTDDRALILDLISTKRIAIWRGIYRMGMLREAGIGFYTDIRRFDDLPFNFQTLAHTQTAVYIPEHLYFYRMGRAGQDVLVDDERLYVHFDIFSHLDEFIDKTKERPLLDQLQVCKLNTHLWGLGKIKKELVSEYGGKARADLDRNYRFGHNFLLYLAAVGKRLALAYFLIHFGWYGLAKKLVPQGVEEEADLLAVGEQHADDIPPANVQRTEDALPVDERHDEAVHPVNGQYIAELQRVADYAVRMSRPE